MPIAKNSARKMLLLLADCCKGSLRKAICSS
nr:MAG TPA: hypothetical protein [Caudoviricetes sp.]